MNNFFQKIPFIRITSLFLIGVLLMHLITFRTNWIAIVLTILLSLLIFLWHNSNYAVVKIQNLLISACIILAGLFYANREKEKQLPDFDRNDYYLAEVCQKPDEKAKTFQSILEIQNYSLPLHERVIAYFSKDQFDSTISTGDQLVIMAKPQAVRNMGNPFELDYQNMLQKKEIWFSVYLTEGTYMKTGIKINRMKYWPEQIREKLISKFAATNIGKQERSVVEALTLGYRAELDPETTDYFASTGSMHVLAVSGLHVGLIYFILGFFLSGIKRLKAGNFIYTSLMLLLLWCYAFITGFSPSVQRATVMFTFIIIGNILRRPVNIYNTLTGSALLLILLNPEVIFEASFQLSYIAVFGIVLLQPKLAQLIKVKNRFLKFLWDLLTVSFAAQLATFPLGLFYFNQFPNFFWLSNFFVIPGATIIIWLTFGFFVFSLLPIIPVIFAQLIQWSTSLMIGILKIISEIPHSVSEGIVINSLQVWIIYGISSSVIIFCFSKKKLWLFYGLILILCLQSSILAIDLSLMNKKCVYVYNSRNTLIHLINGRTNYLLSDEIDSLTITDTKMVKEVLKHLKLDEPIVLNKSKLITYESPDLKITNNKIQFLNCSLEIEGLSKNNNLLNFRIFDPKMSLSKKSSFLILAGNGYFPKKNTHSINHITKNSGAWYLDLNSVNNTESLAIASIPRLNE